jgi:ABC-2 type transport system ATP-binding protein
MVAIECVSVKKNFGERTVLSDVSFELGFGEVMGLVGKNGSGKTTLCDIIAGVQKASSGLAYVAGQAIENWKTVGYSPQDIGVYPPLSVKENLDVFSRLVGERYYSEIVEALGLGPNLKRTVSELSYGTQRRVHTAIAMLSRKPILILDEPTAGVDADTRDSILGLILRFKRDGGTAVYVTHQITELEEISNFVVCLRNGVCEIVRAAELRETVGILFQPTGSKACPESLSDRKLNINQFGTTVLVSAHEVNDVLAVLIRNSCRVVEVSRHRALDEVLR